DADLTDAHTVTVVGNPVIVTPDGHSVPATGLGTFTATIVEDNGDADPIGHVEWTFSVDNSLAEVQSLTSGPGFTQRIFQTYTLEIDDAHGGTTTQDITVSIAGSNDAPVIHTDTLSVVNGTLLGLSV